VRRRGRRQQRAEVAAPGGKVLSAPRRRRLAALPLQKIGAVHDLVVVKVARQRGPTGLRKSLRVRNQVDRVRSAQSLEKQVHRHRQIQTRRDRGLASQLKHVRLIVCESHHRFERETRLRIGLLRRIGQSPFAAEVHARQRQCVVDERVAVRGSVHLEAENQVQRIDARNGQLPVGRERQARIARVTRQRRHGDRRQIRDRRPRGVQRSKLPIVEPRIMRHEKSAVEQLGERRRRGGRSRQRQRDSCRRGQRPKATTAERAKAVENLIHANRRWNEIEANGRHY